MLIEDVIAIPKIVLHEHLDGSVLPSTMPELAAEAGLVYKEAAISAPQGATLERYLECFAAPLALLQNAAALERVAEELTQQWLADGVIHGEVRFAPELHTRCGLTLEEAVEAVLAGLARGSVPARLILTAMRNHNSSGLTASVAARYAGKGVVGFDLAGPEIGYPLSEHASAINTAKDAGLGITLHAGEAVGPHAVVEALELGAHRIGHGVTSVLEPSLLERLALSNTLLEVCVTSNIQTGAAGSVLEHQVGVLNQAGVNVSLQVDNRTVSGVSLSQEMHAVSEAFGWGSDALLAMLDRSVNAAFLSAEEKQTLLNLVRASRQQSAQRPPGL